MYSKSRECYSKSPAGPKKACESPPESILNRPEIAPKAGRDACILACKLAVSPARALANRSQTLLEKRRGSLPESAQNRPQKASRGSPNRPKIAPGTPSGPPRAPNGVSGHPGSVLGRPQGGPEGPWGDPGDALGTPWGLPGAPPARLGTPSATISRPRGAKNARRESDLLRDSLHKRARSDFRQCSSDVGSISGSIFECVRHCGWSCGRLASKRADPHETPQITMFREGRALRAPTGAQAEIVMLVIEFARFACRGNCIGNGPNMVRKGSPKATRIV